MKSILQRPNVMVDLETMGTLPGSSVVAIGAVHFTDTIKSSFYMTISLKSNAEAGLRIDDDTVNWWLSQSIEARSLFRDKNATQLPTALRQFSAWMFNIGKVADILLWGNGATFDNVLLRSAYDAINTKAPWSYRNDMCYRTIKNIYPDVPMNRVGTHHNAMDDAESQALHLIDIINTKG